MSTSTKFDLQVLEHRLQALLRVALADSSLCVRCAARPSMLGILVQHGPILESSAQVVWPALAQVLHQGLLQGGLEALQTSAITSLRIYLRRAGEVQPYLMRSVSVRQFLEQFSSASTPAIPKANLVKVQMNSLTQPGKLSAQVSSESDAPACAPLSVAVENDRPVSVPSQVEHQPETDRVEKGSTTVADAPTEAETDALAVAHHSAEAMVLTASATPGGDQVQQTSADAGETQSGSAIVLATPRGLDGALAKSKSSQSSSLELAAEDDARPLLGILQIERWSVLLNQAFSKSWNPFWVALVSLVAGVSGVSVYALTRPCVIGPCTLLSTAERLNQESLQMLQTAGSTEEVMLAYENLLEANYQLSTIPFWSRHHQLAQSLLTTYQADADLVAKIVTAQRQAREAAVDSQNPPHPLPIWQNVRAKWQDAIAQLQQIPPDATVSGFVETKLSEYQANLLTIDRQISQEQAAQEKVAAARTAAKMAEAREGLASTLESWQQVYVTWQVVVNRLSEIPTHTMAYAEAQQLMAIYEPRLIAARDRWTREQTSASAYARALALAEEAQLAEQGEQWSQATSRWRDALTHAQEVAKDTSYYEQMQTLISAYTEAAEQAEQRLSIALLVEQVRPRLNQACEALPELCTVTLGPEEIRLEVSSTYETAVQQAIISGGLPADTTLSGGLAKIAGLLRTVSDAGTLTQVAVGLYGPNERLLGTYVPSLSGFVQPQIGTVDAVEPETN